MKLKEGKIRKVYFNHVEIAKIIGTKPHNIRSWRAKFFPQYNSKNKRGNKLPVELIDSFKIIYVLRKHYKMSAIKELLQELTKEEKNEVIKEFERVKHSEQ